MEKIARFGLTSEREVLFFSALQTISFRRNLTMRAFPAAVDSAGAIDGPGKPFRRRSGACDSGPAYSVEK